MNKKLIHALLPLTLLALTSAPCRAESAMAAGAWEMRLKVSVQETEGEAFKTVNEGTMKYCLSKAFLDKDPYLTPGVDKDKMEKKNAKCAISDEMRGNNAASWKMVCEMADGMKIDMDIHNKASKNELVSNIAQTVIKDDERHQMKLDMKARFIGKCTKDMLNL
jgi:hypothetical protein